MLIAQPLEHPLRRVPLLGALDESSRSHWSMISVNPSSFGRLTGADRRYPGGTEKLSIFLMLSRETPKCRAASRWLMPSRQARRTFR